jgi:hypothetical protein
LIVANFSDVDGAFKSLTDTLQNRLSPFFEQQVSEAWLGALGHASAIARETLAWNALPESSPDYFAVAGALDGAARKLASAAVSQAIITALREVEASLSRLDGLLASAGL